MNPPETYEAVINRKRYSVETATLLAGDDYWDGHNFERGGRNRFLYRTPKGNYFLITLSCWQGETTRLIPVDQDEAIGEFEMMREKRVEFEAAFPGVEIAEA
jgi:hypothetical protein